MSAGNADPNFTHSTYRGFIANGIINVTAINDAGIIVYANPAELKLLGYNTDEYEGFFIDNFFSVDNGESVAELTKQRVNNIEVSVLCKNGSHKCVLLSTQNFTDEHNITCTYLFGRDITPYKKTESLLSYLNTAAEELAQARDTHTALQKISSLIVPKFANWFAIDILNNNSLELLVLAHEDPEAIKWAHEYRKNNPVDLNSSQGSAMVIKTGKPSLVPVVTYDMIAEHIKDPKKQLTIKKLGIHSIITVAIFNKEKVTGIITFISTVHGKHYDEADLRFAQNLASHIGLALDNTHLNEAAAEEIKHRAVIEDKLKITQSQLRSALSSGLVGTWTRDLKKQIIYPDESLSKMFGIPYSPEGCAPETLVNLVKGDDGVSNLKRNKAMQEGGLYETEYQIEVDGQLKWFFVRGKNEVDRHGKPESFAGVVVDVTERKQAEMALKQSEDIFKLIAETVPQKIFVANQAGYITYYNPQWAEFTGVEIAEIGRLTLAHFIHPDDVEKNIERWRHVVQTGQPFQYEHRFKNKQGEFRWHLTRALPLKDEHAQIVKWIGSITDIHDQKLKEQQKDEFISIASHELRTPLTTIKAFFQLAKRGLDAADKSFGFIDKAGKQLDRLERLISDLLDVSKINAGKMAYNPEPFNFDEALKEAVESVQHTTDGHQIVTDLHAGILLHGDKLRIEQVIINLLSNAVKYSPGSNKVIIHSHVSNNNIIVSVQDFGIGIAAENLTDLFERFYRVDNTAMRFQGLGLGLFIASEIIKRHNGSFWIESQLGEGSTFYFLLPVKGKQEFCDIDTDGQTFYKGNFIDIKYKADTHWLQVDWQGYQNFDSVKKGCIIILELLKKNNCSKVLNDNTNVLGSWSEAVDWGSEVWFPAMQQAGLQYFAWVFSPSTFSQMSAKKSIDVIMGKITAQFFMNTTDAAKWLADK